MSPVFTVVAAALFDGEGRVLVQQRPADKAMAGLWEFPGGKVDPGETPEQALVRELNEELGIAVRPEDLRPATFASEAAGERHMILLLYRCHDWEGRPMPLAATALRWAGIADLRALPMPPADTPFVEALATSRAVFDFDHDRPNPDRISAP